jgi:hypothetical protein
MATWVQLFDKAIKSVQATTDSAPTLPTEGVPILGVASLTLVAECDPGLTFGAAVGQLDLYLWDDIVGAWTPVIYQAIKVPNESIGKRRFAVMIAISNARGRIAHIANGINAGGGGLTLYFLPTYSWFPGRIS